MRQLCARAIAKIQRQLQIGEVLMAKLMTALFCTSFAIGCHAASFDCAKAVSLTEMTICNDSVLSKLDDELSEIYKRAKVKAADQTAFQQQTKAAWKWREANCRSRDCLVNWYTQRKMTLVRAAGLEPASKCQADGPVTVSGLVMRETLTLEPDGRKVNAFILVASNPICVRIEPMEPTDKSGAKDVMRTRFQLVSVNNAVLANTIAKFASRKVTVTGNLSTDNITQYYAVTDAIDVKSIGAM